MSSVCSKNGILILNMDEIFVVGGRPQCKTPQITNLHHYHVELFYIVIYIYIYIDMYFQELNNQFSEAKYQVSTLYGLLES